MEDQIVLIVLAILGVPALIIVIKVLIHFISGDIDPPIELDDLDPRGPLQQ